MPEAMTRTNHGALVPMPAIRPGRKSDYPCDGCGQMEVFVEDIELSDYDDKRIRCYGCGRTYCVDGPDA